MAIADGDAVRSAEQALDGLADALRATLGRILQCGRSRARLSLEESASSLGVAVAKLQALEEGRERLHASLLRRLADLYPVDGKLLSDVARLESDLGRPESAGGDVTALLNHLRRLLLRYPDLASEDRRIARLEEALLASLRIGQEGRRAAAERQGDYFSIGHLSDRLLKALQDPAFHDLIEQMAQQYGSGDLPQDEAGRPATPSTEKRTEG